MRSQKEDGTSILKKLRGKLMEGSGLSGGEILQGKMKRRPPSVREPKTFWLVMLAHSCYQGVIESARLRDGFDVMTSVLCTD